MSLPISDDFCDILTMLLGIRGCNVSFSLNKIVRKNYIYLNYSKEYSQEHVHADEKVRRI